MSMARPLETGDARHARRGNLYQTVLMLSLPSEPFAMMLWQRCRQVQRRDGPLPDG